MVKYTVKNPDGTTLGETEIGGTVENITMRNVNQTATLHIEPDNGYNWQGDFEVTGADASASPLEGVLYLSNPVSDITVNIIYKKNVYTITSTGNHCTISGDTIIEFEGTANLRIAVDTGYQLPNNVTVTGASSTYSKSTGIIVLYNPTGNVTVTVNATPVSYAIINKLTHCTSRSGNPTTIKRDSSATLNYDLSAGYVFPNVINVVNASYTWDNNGGLVLSNPTGIVTVTIVCPAQDYTINYSTVNCDWDGAQNISVEAAAVATLTPHEGYQLPDNITVTNCTYTYDKSTGIVQMVNPTGNVTVTCAAVKITYSITTNVTYGTYTGSTTIEYGGLASVTITANSGYKLPDTITVTGATYTFSNGVVYLSSPTRNVTITCVCVEDTPTTVTLEAGTYQFISQPNVAVSATIGVDIAGKMNTLTADNTYGGKTDFNYISVSYNQVSIGTDENTITCDDHAEWLYNEFTATDTSKLRIITIETDQQVSQEFYDWAITQGNLVKQTSTGETWVLNDNVTITGTNYYNNIEMVYSGMKRAYPIKSLKMYEYSDGPAGNAYAISGDENEEYSEYDATYSLYTTGGGLTGWEEDSSGTKYNIWTFETAPTGDLLTWLQANGTKQ